MSGWRELVGADVLDVFAQMEKQLHEAEAERDRYRAEVTDRAIACQSMEGQLHEAQDERDQLQARLDSYEGDVQERESMRRLIEASSLGTPEFRAMADQTPPGVAQAIVMASEYLRRAEAAEDERDRLRAERDQARDTADRLSADWLKGEAERGLLVAIAIAARDYVEAEVDDQCLWTDAVQYRDGLIAALAQIDDDTPTELERLRGIAVNTATDVRILRKAFRGKRMDVCDVLIGQIYDRVEPFDVGDAADVMGEPAP